MPIYKLEAKEKTLLSDLLLENGVVVDKLCGGLGTCGKCKIKAIGDLSPVCDAEKNHLTSQELSENVRLSCKTYVCGKCTVEIFEKEKNKEEINIEDIKACCAAVDIGTTVLEAYFFSLPDFKLIKKSKMKNLQSQFGADVISRISYAKDEESINRLKKVVRLSFKEMAGSLYDKVKNLVITGNTAMLHMYVGINPASIGKYPFEAESMFGYSRENTYFPPCISSYVGADIVTAILASGMEKNAFPSLLVDIGTNGEIVLFDGKTFHCTSTSAGPALEGALISMGMIALDGAIKKVDKNGDFETIGKEKPIGICGSGLIDAVSYMLDIGILDINGYLEKPFEIKDSGVFITPQDIRQIQLAKSAICAGIETILAKNNINIEDIKTLYIAGSLGNNADINNCKKIGLIPYIDNKRIKMIGNAALNGACMILKDEKMKEKARDIANNSKAYDLSLTGEFSQKYIENMMF